MENVLATTVAAPLDRKKPLVKEFFDRDAEIVKHLELRLPHVTSAIPAIKKLYSSKDGLTHKYRVNWYTDVADKIVVVKKMVSSSFVEVVTTKEGRVVSFEVR